MTLIKITTKKIGKGREDRHISAYIPENLASFLTLYNMANGLSKSSIIIKLLRDWMLTEKEEGINQETLIHDLANNFLLVWKKKKALDCHYSLKDFKNQLIAELQWKGLSIETIREILIQFNNGTK